MHKTKKYTLDEANALLEAVGKGKYTFEKIVAWHQGVSPSKQKVKCKCLICNKEWEARFTNLVNHKSGCSHCYGRKGSLQVRHYFVLARSIKKDGSLSKKYDIHDFLDKDEAQKFLNHINEMNTNNMLSYKLIEYVARNQTKEHLMSVVPKSVKEAYDLKFKVSINFKTILWLVEQKVTKFGKIDMNGRACTKKVTQTRTNLVHHLVLLSFLLDYAKKGVTINFDSKIDKIMYDELIYTYAKPLIARGYPFDEMFQTLTKKVLNSQNSDETIILEISQIVLFGGNYGKIRFAYENQNLIRKFFFGNSFIELSPLVYAFNREMIANKKAYRQEAYKKSGEYQKANKEKINEYARSRYRAKKSPNDTTTTADDTTLQQSVS